MLVYLHQAFYRFLRKGGYHVKRDFFMLFFRTISGLFASAIVCTPATAQVAFNENFDEFTGQSNSFISAFSTAGDDMMIGWACSNLGLQVVMTHSYLIGDSNDKVTVMYRFDDNAPSEPRQFALMPGNRATRFDVHRVGPFVQEAIAAQQMMLRVVDPRDGETLTSTFELGGLGEQMQKLDCFAD